MVKGKENQIVADDWKRASNAQRAWMICQAISDGMMDQEKVKKLLEVADGQDQISLKVLHNAVVKCIRDYQAESTSARLNDWQKAESALEQQLVVLSEKYLGHSPTLANTLAVADYLRDQGWKVKKSAVYKHKKEGKLRCEADGTYRIDEVDRYAQTYLKRADGSASEKLEKLQQEKLHAEIEKTKAQARHWTMKAEMFTGAYVPKDLFEGELAKRAAVFRNDLETFARAEASEIVNRAAGNADTIPDLIEWLLGRFESFLARYGEERTFRVILPPPGQENETREDETDDERDEETEDEE